MSPIMTGSATATPRAALHGPSSLSRLSASPTSLHPTVLPRFPTAFAQVPSGFGQPSQWPSGWPAWPTLSGSLPWIPPTAITQIPVPAFQTSSHSGISKVAILALSISLGLSLAIALVLFYVLRRRRARRAAEHSQQMPLPYGRLESEEQKDTSDSDRQSYHGRHNEQPMRSADLSGSGPTTGDHDVASRRSVPPPDEPEQDAHIQEDGSIGDSSVLATEDGSVGRAPLLTRPTPRPTPSGPSPAAAIKPPPRQPEQPPALPTEGPDTVLLRVPVELAHRVMATMAHPAGIPEGQGSAESESVDAGDLDPPPAYEARSPDVVGTLPPGI